MVLDYGKMLGKAYSQLPLEVFEHERFEVSQLVCAVFGSRTIFHNLKGICPFCERPDTRNVKEKRFYFLVCEGYGARSPVKPI